MPMRPARTCHLLPDPTSFGLLHLEARRVLDGALCRPACDEIIEITRLDGAESEWVRADDPEYGTTECTSGDAPGSDSDMYSFTTRPVAQRADEVTLADKPGTDEDLYDFGQDRGSPIDDDAAYEPREQPTEVPVTDILIVDAPTGLPAIPPIESDVTAAPLAEEPAAALPIAIVPGAGKVTWIGTSTIGPSMVASAAEGRGDTSPAPATWIDLVALGEPVMLAQP